MCEVEVAKVGVGQKEKTNPENEKKMQMLLFRH